MSDNTIVSICSVYNSAIYNTSILQKMRFQQGFEHEIAFSKDLAKPIPN